MEDMPTEMGRPETSVCFDSANAAGLKQVKRLMRSMGVMSKLNGPYHYWPYLDRYSLVVPKKSLSIYRQLIGFNHPRKKKLLERLTRGPVAFES